MMERIVELFPIEKEDIVLSVLEGENRIILTPEKEGTVGYPQYSGAYEVTPSFEKQTLETAYKVMMGNVEVEPIPMEKVSNTAGGMTLIIGG